MEEAFRRGDVEDPARPLLDLPARLFRDGDGRARALRGTLRLQTGDLQGGLELQEARRRPRLAGANEPLEGASRIPSGPSGGPQDFGEGERNSGQKVKFG